MYLICFVKPLKTDTGEAKQKNAGFHSRRFATLFYIFFTFRAEKGMDHHLKLYKFPVQDELLLYETERNTPKRIKIFKIFHLPGAAYGKVILPRAEKTAYTFFRGLPELKKP
jgi:hypothetical protein